MPIETSREWDLTNLAHRYTVSFFKSQYGDDPQAIFADNEYPNRELIYFNIADPDNTTEATICAGLLVNYIEAQGIPYHEDGSRNDCFNELVPHLSVGDSHVLYTADIIDHYFKFLGE